MAVDDLPLPVVNFLNVIGVPWPYIDEDTVAKFADLTRDCARAVENTHADASRSIGAIADAHQGASTEAMSSGWTTMSSKHVYEVVDACHVLADALDVGPDLRHPGRVRRALAGVAEMTGPTSDGVQVLPLGQAAVMQICVDYALTLICDQDGDTYEIRIEQAFEFTAADGAALTLDPEGDPTGLGPALACTRTLVAAANAFADGRLQIAFVDGSLLAVPAAAKYESWGLVGPAGFRIVSGPGNRLTVWPGDDPIAS